MIAVTGSNGFLGHAVTAALRHRHLDFLRTESKLWGCDIVIHLAGETQDDRLMYLNNVYLTRSLLESAHAAAVKKFVFISSVAVKDLEDGYTASSYAWSKYVCEQMVRQALRIDRRILRLPTVYDKGMKCWTIMALKSILRGQNPWNMISLDEAVSRILKEVL